MQMRCTLEHEHASYALSSNPHVESCACSDAVHAVLRRLVLADLQNSLQPCMTRKAYLANAVGAVFCLHYVAGRPGVLAKHAAAGGLKGRQKPRKYQDFLPLLYQAGQTCEYLRDLCRTWQRCTGRVGTGD